MKIINKSSFAFHLTSLSFPLLAPFLAFHTLTAQFFCCAPYGTGSLFSRLRPSLLVTTRARVGNLYDSICCVPVCIYPPSSRSFADLTASIRFSCCYLAASRPPAFSFNGSVIVTLLPQHLSDRLRALLLAHSSPYIPKQVRPTMRSRRNPSQFHSLSPHDPSSTGATSTTAFPRASSPSGFSQLLSKPAKWFTRNQTGQRAPSSGSSEPRSSTSSFVRKPKISHPTDLRPILPSLQSEPYIQSPTQGASRSVFITHLTEKQSR